MLVPLMLVSLVYWGRQQWMQHVTSFLNIVSDVLKNKSDIIHSSLFNITENNSITHIDLTTAPAEVAQTNKTGRYVSMCAENFDSRRLGNQLFNFAAMLYVAKLTGRRVAMVQRHPDGWLDRWFSVPVTRVNSINSELCPCRVVKETAGQTFYQDISSLYNRSDIADKNLLVCGWFQSWKYTLGVEAALRHHLRLLPFVLTAIHKYLDQIRPPAWTGHSFSRVGIHVRAGDIMKRSALYTIPQRPYFEQAMRRFVSQGLRVQFIVTSDSMEWVRKAINFTSIAYQLNQTSSAKTKNFLVNIAHSEDHNAGFDIGLLSLCDGVIISTGTYGWWGAWLANKTTIYYSDWPRPGSPVFARFNPSDYFPPNWIPIGGPEFLF